MFRILLILILACSATFSQAQDRYFTQFYAQPMHLNPALTGSMNGTFRVSASYRNQWWAVQEGAYTTFTSAADFKIESNAKRRSKGFVGGGIMFTHDNQGEFNSLSNSLGFSAAYHRYLARDKSQIISAGLYFGLDQRGTNYTNYTFEDQYVVLQGYVGATGETLPPNAYSFSDTGLGLNYAGTFVSGAQVFLGGAYWHWNRPNLSYYRDVDTDVFPVETQNTLPTRLDAHLGFKIPSGSDNAWLPRVIFTQQTPFMSIQTGTNYEFTFPTTQDFAFYAGGWARATQNIDGTDLSAIVAMFGFTRFGTTIGFSYEHDFNDLRTDRIGQSAVEFSISYTGRYEEDDLFCPKF